MASLGMGFGAALATRRPFAVTAATEKVDGVTQEEKGPSDWVLAALQKEDQLLETDPILKKVEETNGRKPSVSVPAKKSGGFGGLLAQK